MNTIICPKCGSENAPGAMNCKNCRINLEFAMQHPEQVSASVSKDFETKGGGDLKATSGPASHIMTAPLVVLGLVVGGLFGFLMRPSYPLIGQLPFAAVITRGAELRSWDRALVPLAQESFNYVLLGSLLGAGAGFLAARSLTPRSMMLATTKEAKVTSPARVERGATLEEVETIFGKPEKVVCLDAKTIYVYRDLKVIFADGKVTDVQ